MNRRRIPLWTLLGVALVVALTVGSGALDSAKPTDAQRAAAIESVIRCPSCEDLSVAVSSAPTAVTVRATVTRLVHVGESDQQIEAYLVARYGSAVVLDPPVSGWSGLVWVLPLVVGGAAAVALGVVLVRRRRTGDGGLDLVSMTGSGPADRNERREFLTRSLADADAEFLAGDLSEVDYLALRRRDLAHLASLGPATASATDSATARPAGAPDGASAGTAGRAGAGTRPQRSRSRSRWFLVGAITCFAAALAVAIPLFSSTRLPGQTVTGSVDLSPSQELARTLDQAATVENEGQLKLAAQLYQSVLDSHPNDEVALAQLGWLEYRIGSAGSSATLLADARDELDRAVVLAPGDYAAHLYLGTVLLEQVHDASAAVTQFQLFLADDPPTSVLTQAASTLRGAYTQAGVTVPAAVPAG